MEIPVGFNRPPTMAELVARHVGQVMSDQAALQGQETIEEADDFEIDEDDPDFISKYEFDEMTPEPIDTEEPILVQPKDASTEPPTESDPSHSEVSGGSTPQDSTDPSVSPEK